MKAGYRTPARAALLDFFSAHPDKHFTADQLCSLLCGDLSSPDGGERFGKSTVYRQLSQLCEQNLLRRFEEADGETGSAVHVYQYNDQAHDCEHHFHLKCIRCGKVAHLGCDRTANLIAHIRACHGFSVDCGQSILYGLCADCAPSRLPFGKQEDGQNHSHSESGDLHGTHF